jgi:hypothetical protein
MLALLEQHPRHINSTRPGGDSFYAPLHQAAHGGAPIEVVRQLLSLGAWRTLKNNNGERPIDIARRKSQKHLYSILEPELKLNVPIGILLKIQSHFHAVIKERANSILKTNALRLPELEPLLEIGSARFWFEKDGVDAILISESWHLTADRMGERHHITLSGAALREELTEWTLHPKPFKDSYWVEPGLFLAGRYAGAKDPEEARIKLRNLLKCGIEAFIDLTEEGENGLELYKYPQRRIGSIRENSFSQENVYP